MTFNIFLKRTLLVMLLTSVATIAAAEEEVHWKSRGFLVDSFFEVAMKSAYSTRRHPVRKWTVPVSYYIVQRVGDEDLHRQLTRTHFQYLAEITGLKIEPVESEVAANFLVVLTSENRLEADTLHFYGTDSVLQHEAQLEHSICSVKFAADRKGSIVRAVAMIPVDRARARGNLASCLTEELTHAMGLPNDSLKVFPSIFSRKANHAFLTGLDYLLLKLLYDPRIKVGMSERTAWPILLRIADEYEKANLFNTAEGLATKGGLSALMP